MLAILLHRNGHARGDDFALYLRQARSLFDGNIAEVVADNRFAVINSTGAFSPYAYPWGLPLLLAPFVHLWDLDYNRLKLVEVAAFCIWLVLVHGIVRRRIGRILALGVTAVMATAPALLSHTGQLLSEFPHAAAVAVVIWWLDRMRTRGLLITAATGDLVVLGVLITVAYNFRREAIVLIGAVGVVQLVEIAGRLRHERFSTIPWRNVAIPYVSFAASAAVFQLLLPSMLFPDNGDNPGYIDDRLGGYPRVLTQHIGIGSHPAIGVVILALAVVGAVIGIRRRPGLDGPLAAIAGLSAITVSTHFRMVGRYYFQITPWVLYFAPSRSPQPSPSSGETAIVASSPCSRRCRCCISSTFTWRSCPATSAIPGTSTGRRSNRSVRPILASPRSSTPSSDSLDPTTSSPSTGRAR